MPVTIPGGGGGGLTSPVGIADGGTGATTAAAAVAAIGAMPNGDWPGYPLMTEADLSSDEADAISNPPGDLGWTQSAALDSADITSGVLSINHGNTSTTLTTGARLHKTATFLPGRARAIAAFLSSADLDAANESMGLVFETSPGVEYTHFEIRHNGSVYQIRTLKDGVQVAVAADAPTAGQVSSGIWLMMYEVELYSGQLSFGCLYSLGGVAGTPPTTWTSCGNYFQNTTGGVMSDREIGVVVKTANTDDAFTAKVSALWTGWL